MCRTEKRNAVDERTSEGEDEDEDEEVSPASSTVASGEVGRRVRATSPNSLIALLSLSPPS